MPVSGVEFSSIISILFSGFVSIEKFLIWSFKWIDINWSFADIEIKSETVDKRSYHVNSDKIKKILNFNTKNNIDDAVNSLCLAFKKGKLKDSMTDSKYINVNVLKSLNVK